MHIIFKEIIILILCIGHKMYIPKKHDWKPTSPLLKQAIFCDMSNQREGVVVVATPYVNLKNKCLRYAYLIAWYSYGSPLFIHAKKVQTSHVHGFVWRHNDVIIVDFAQSTNLQWNIGQIWIFCQKSSKYWNFTGFLHINKRRKWRF